MSMNHMIENPQKGGELPKINKVCYDRLFWEEGNVTQKESELG